MNAELNEVRKQVAVGTRMLVDFGLSTGVRSSLGHVSMRVPGDPNKFVVKGRGYRLDVLSKIRPEDLVVCDLDGNLVDGPPNIIPCFEVKIHSCILRDRPEMNSVVHVHPTFTVVMTVLGATLHTMAQEGNRLVADPLPVYPKQKIVTTEEEGTELSRILGQGQAALLFGHGAVTVGASMERSITDMLHLEHQATMNYYAWSAAGKDHAYVPRDLVMESAGSGGSQFSLPHFKQAMEKAGPPLYGGAWEAWFEEAASNL